MPGTVMYLNVRQSSEKYRNVYVLDKLVGGTVMVFRLQNIFNHILI